MQRLHIRSGRSAAWVPLLAGALGACIDLGAFPCTNNAECQDGSSVDGICTEERYCAFFDPDCDSDYRYHARSPSGLGGTCVVDGDDTGSGSATSNGTTTNGTTTATTANVTSSDAMSTSGTDTGTTGSGGCGSLTQQGLLLRYFLDEATRGVGGGIVEDAADDPADLVLSGPGVVYVDGPLGAGLQWPSASTDDRAEAPVPTKVLNRLGGAVQATIEVVAEIRAADVAGSRFINVGEGELAGRFGLSAESPSELRFRLNDQMAAIWSVPPVPDRRVIQLVFDSTARPGARARLWVDGSEAEALGGAVEIPANANINNLANALLTLGNRPAGARSFEGELYYAAVYDTALDAEQLARNRDVLACSDDGV